MLILLQRLISGRIKNGKAVIPAPFSANRMLRGLAVVFSCLFFTASPIHAAPLSITVVLSENSGTYLEFSNALRESLLKKNIALTVTDDLAKPIPDSGLVIGAGMKAAAAIAASKAPAVLNVLISKSGYDQLLRDFPHRAHSRTFSAIFMEQPVERGVRLIKALLPGKRRVGVMSDNLSPEELSQLRQRMAGHGLSMREQEVGQSLSLYAALQALLRDSDVLLALPDELVYNSLNIRNILLAAYRSGVPMIGFSHGYVGVGALGVVFSTSAQVAGQVASAIQQFGETRTLPSAQYTQMFEVATNEQVARSLGMKIKSMEELRREMSAIEGDAP